MEHLPNGIYQNVTEKIHFQNAFYTEFENGLYRVMYSLIVEGKREYFHEWFMLVKIDK